MGMEHQVTVHHRIMLNIKAALAWSSIRIQRIMVLIIICLFKNSIQLKTKVINYREDCKTTTILEKAVEAKKHTAMNMVLAFLFQKPNQVWRTQTIIWVIWVNIIKKNKGIIDTAINLVDGAKARTEQIIFIIREAMASKVTDSDPIIRCHSIGLIMVKLPTPLRNSVPHHQCDHSSSVVKSVAQKTMQITIIIHQLKDKYHLKRFFKLQQATLIWKLTMQGTIHQ